MKVENVIKNKKETGFKGIITQKSIDAHRVCPTHGETLNIKVSIAYLPKGEMLEDCDLINLINALTEVPISQEDLVTEIIENLDCLRIKGCFVIIKGHHGCLDVKEPPLTITSGISGEFFDDPIVKDEVLQLLSGGSK
jgi:GTP cyclohydrolase I